MGKRNRIGIKKLVVLPLLVWSCYTASCGVTLNQQVFSLANATELHVTSPESLRVGDEFSCSFLIVDSKTRPIDSVQIVIGAFNKKKEALITIVNKGEYLPVGDNTSEYVYTDTTGVAVIQMPAFSREGVYSYTICTSDSSIDLLSSTIEVLVRKRDWVFMLVVGLIGGLCLFLYGMHLLSNGLQNSAGNKMRIILEKLTNNRFLGLGIGALVTMVIQSSSATNVMLVSFVDSKLMRFRQTIGVVLGAAIGTTITAQIIAFKITDFALVFVSIGLLLFFVAKKQRITEVGHAILGFGILFYGMHIMSESMYPLRSFQPFIDMVISLENPLLGILVGTLFTALIQSSSAFIGILIVLAMQGLLSFNASVSLIIGANIGTSITAILASINTSREAQQVAFAHTFIKILGALIIIVFMPLFVKGLVAINHTSTEEVTPRIIANAHTLYNVVLVLIFLPFTNKIAWLVVKVFPARQEEKKEFSVSYLNKAFLHTPDIALNAARKELLLMMKEVKNMFVLIIIPFEERRSDVLEQIKQKEKQVNFWRDELAEFLVELSRGERSKEQIEETFFLLNAVKEYEQIADVISTQMVSRAETWCCSDFEFSEAGLQELLDYHRTSVSIMQKSIKVYKAFDLKKAEKLKEKYYSYREDYFRLEKKHYKRLRKNVEPTLSSSKTHLELITLFRVISSHATNTARTVIRSKRKAEEII